MPSWKGWHHGDETPVVLWWCRNGVRNSLKVFLRCFGAVANGAVLLAGHPVHMTFILMSSTDGADLWHLEVCFRDGFGDVWWDLSCG